jgi:hypothetical protein
MSQIEEQTPLPWHRFSVRAEPRSPDLPSAQSNNDAQPSHSKDSCADMYLARPYVAKLCKLLETAERNVSEGTARIAQRRTILSQLEPIADEQEVQAARNALMQFEQLQKLHVADRDRLRSELQIWERCQGADATNHPLAPEQIDSDVPLAPDSPSTCSNPEAVRHPSQNSDK